VYEVLGLSSHPLQFFSNGRLVFSTLAVFFCVASVFGAADTPRFITARPNASGPPSLKPRKPFAKLSPNELTSRQDDSSAIIKIIDSAARLRDGVMTVIDSVFDGPRVARTGMTRRDVETSLAVANDLILRNAGVANRIFSQEEDMLDSQQRAGETHTLQELPDLNTFFRIDFNGRSAGDTAAILVALNQLPIVEYAGPVAKLAAPPSDIPPTTPLFTQYQGYTAAAPSGIDVPYARLVAGGRGEYATIVDVEDG
jgi:hypothetical protein